MLIAKCIIKRNISGDMSLLVVEVRVINTREGEGVRVINTREGEGSEIYFYLYAYKRS